MGTPGKNDIARQLAEIISAPVVKHSVTIAGHATSVTLEEPFWERLKLIAKQENKSLNALIGEIDALRIKSPSGNLSSALRLYVLTTLEIG